MELYMAGMLLEIIVWWKITTERWMVHYKLLSRFYIEPLIIIKLESSEYATSNLTYSPSLHPSSPNSHSNPMSLAVYSAHFPF